MLFLRSNVEKARLKWLCRRGMKELDVLMERYLEHRYDVAPEIEREAFIALMAAEDPDIWAWVMGFQEMPEQREIANVIEQLRVHY